MLDRASKIVLNVIDFDGHLIQMPLPLRDLTHKALYLFADFLGKQSPKPIDPKADTFMADVYATFVEQVLDITKREWKPDINHYCELDDFGRRL